MGNQEVPLGYFSIMALSLEKFDLLLSSFVPFAKAPHRYQVISWITCEFCGESFLNVARKFVWAASVYFIGKKKFQIFKGIQ